MLTFTEAEPKLIAFIADELKIEPEKIVPAARINEDLGADSLSRTIVIMAIEHVCKVEVTDDEDMDIVTIHDAFTLAKHKLRQKNLQAVS